MLDINKDELDLLIKGINKLLWVCSHVGMGETAYRASLRKLLEKLELEKHFSR